MIHHANIITARSRITTQHDSSAEMCHNKTYDSHRASRFAADRRVAVLIKLFRINAVAAENGPSQGGNGLQWVVDQGRTINLKNRLRYKIGGGWAEIQGGNVNSRACSQISVLWGF